VRGSRVGLQAVAIRDRETEGMWVRPPFMRSVIRQDWLGRGEVPGDRSNAASSEVDLAFVWAEALALSVRLGVGQAVVANVSRQSDGRGPTNVRRYQEAEPRQGKDYRHRDRAKAN